MKIINILFFLIYMQVSLFSQDNHEYRLNYKWFPPEGKEKFFTVVVLGGSEGGLRYGEQWAEILNKKGYGVFALAYFGGTGLKQQLEEIPLEYFTEAVDTLLGFRGVSRDAISLIAVSKGTEAALLLAREKDIFRVIFLASPSCCVWQGINRENYNSDKSSWSFTNQPLPYLKYDYSKGVYPLVNLYSGVYSVKDDDPVLLNTGIISSEIILFSGGKDNVWPSSFMASMLKTTAEKRDDKNKIELHDFPDAGHGFLIPFSDEKNKIKILEGIKSALDFLGGSYIAFEKAMTESQEIVLGKLEKERMEVTR